MHVHDSIHNYDICFLEHFKVQLRQIFDGFHYKAFGALMYAWLANWLIGGITDDVKALFFLIVLDFALGFGYALKNKCISKLALRRGAIKMLIYFSLVIAANLLDKPLGSVHHIFHYVSINDARTFVVLYLCITEMISILEKAEKFGIEIPTRLLNSLKKWLKNESRNK